MAALDQDVFFSTIKQLNRRLLAKEFSAEELARAFALRLQQLGPRYNALALPLVQESIRQAKTVDADLKRGRLRGPLQGVPYAVKDLLSYAGQTPAFEVGIDSFGLANGFLDEGQRQRVVARS
jgi:Asp-tRNA(Asn)/Glu-tRNA(Gln) amidotransferase A subunit family amidase